MTIADARSILEIERMNISLILGSLVTVSVMSFAITGSLRVSLATGIAAALCSWATVIIVTERWRKSVASLGRDPDDVSDAIRENALRSIALEERIVLLRAVVNSLPDGLLVLSRNGTLIEHNRALGEVLEAPASKLVGFTARELLRDDRILAAVESAASTSEPVTVETPRLSVRVASLSGVPGALALIASH
ncbi:MAG: PAS domain-containing protein [Archangium sp.]|nr:PAS domain-containing protein [Archangium sp.]